MRFACRFGEGGAAPAAEVAGEVFAHVGGDPVGEGGQVVVEPFARDVLDGGGELGRSEEHTSELQSR